MDEKTEALIGPEPVLDPAAAAALERQVRAENDDLRVRIAYHAFMVIAVFGVGFLFVLEPLLNFLGRSGQLLVWIVVNIPLVLFLGRVWRESRFPMGYGHGIEGYRARMLALGIFLLSLTAFLAAGLAEELWQWVATPGW
jgi:hypothetical protein